ncbi:MAG: hypothetical protein SFZ23_11055 [Planctomycetota bacterium]|nr:hypothetical protein [Planctomycetota bacterium]
MKMRYAIVLIMFVLLLTLLSACPRSTGPGPGRIPKRTPTWTLDDLIRKLEDGTLKQGTDYRPFVMDLPHNWIGYSYSPLIDRNIVRQEGDPEATGLMLFKDDRRIVALYLVDDAELFAACVYRNGRDQWLFCDTDKLNVHIKWSSIRQKSIRDAAPGKAPGPKQPGP